MDMYLNESAQSLMHRLGPMHHTTYSAARRHHMVPVDPHNDARPFLPLTAARVHREYFLVWTSLLVFSVFQKACGWM